MIKLPTMTRRRTHGIVAAALICACLCHANLADAQKDNPRKFHFGASTGVIAAQIDGDELSGSATKKWTVS